MNRLLLALMLAPLVIAARSNGDEQAVRATLASISAGEIFFPKSSIAKSVTEIFLIWIILWQGPRVAL